MAGGAVIGALRVVLGADTAALEKGLKEAQSGLAAFGTSIATGVAAAATAVAAAGAVIGTAISKTIDDFDKLSKTSQKLGIPVEQLSALAYAADLSDVSFESLSKSVGKLSKNMVEAAAKPTSEAANAFKALGVSVTDSNGKLKSSDQVMGDLADAFEGLKDGPGKTAVAMAIFGKAGADLIPLLNGGRDSLKEMNDEAKAFGAIVSTQAGKQAEAFNDNMTRLGYAVKGVVVQTASQLLPTMVNASQAMVDWAKNSGVLQTALNVVSTAMKGLVTGGIIVGAVFKTLAEYVSTVSTALGLLVKGEFSKAWERIQMGVTGIADTAKSSFGVVDGLWRGSVTGAAAAASATDEAAKKQKDFNYQALAGKNAIDQFLASQQKSIAGQQAEALATDEAAGKKAALKVILETFAIAQANNINLTQQQTDKMVATAVAADIMAQKLSNIQLIGQSNPFAALTVALDNTNAKLAAGNLSLDNYATLSQQAAQLSARVWSMSAESMGQSFESIGSSLASMNDGWARAAKIGQAIGAAVAFVNAYVAASEAFAKTPFPANVAIAAGVLAKGIALVAAIKGAVIPGHAMGGAFRVPGGIGGGDKVPFQAMLEPGELVEVSSNRSDGYKSEGNRSSAPSTVNLSMPIVTTREALTMLFDEANKLFADGYVLKVNPV